MNCDVISNMDLKEKMSKLEAELRRTRKNAESDELLKKRNQVLCEQVKDLKPHEEFLQSLVEQQSLANAELSDAINVKEVRDEINLIENQAKELETEINKIKMELKIELGKLRLAEELKRDERINFYKTELAKLNQKFEEVDKQCQAREEQLEAKIIAVNAAKNRKMREIRSKFNIELVQQSNKLEEVQDETKKLKKKLDELKAAQSEEPPNKNPASERNYTINSDSFIEAQKQYELFEQQFQKEPQIQVNTDTLTVSNQNVNPPSTSFARNKPQVFVGTKRTNLLSINRFSK